MLLHPRFELGGSLPWTLVYPLAFGLLFMLLWLSRGKVGRGPVAGLAFFVLVLAPVLGLIDFSYLRLSFVADRFMYLAILGPIAVVAGAFARLVAARTTRVVAGTVVVSLLCVRAQAHARNFHDDEVLFRHAVAENPRAWGAWSYLAYTYNEQGRYPDAMRCAAQAADLRSDDEQVYNNLGRALLGLGETDEALVQIDRALKLDPDLPEALNNRGLVLDALGRSEEALATWEVAVAHGPRLAPAHNNLGIARARQGRDAEAEVAFRAALRLRPDMVEAHSNLGVVLARLGRREEALACYRAALRLREAYPEAHNNLGTSLDALGRGEEARSHYRRALELRPDYAEARANLERSPPAGGR
jgi:Flp pilus assembly protein TadD